MLKLEWNRREGAAVYAASWEKLAGGCLRRRSRQLLEGPRVSHTDKPGDDSETSAPLHHRELSARDLDLCQRCGGGGRGSGGLYDEARFDLIRTMRGGQVLKVSATIKYKLPCLCERFFSRHCDIAASSAPLASLLLALAPQTHLSI